MLICLYIIYACFVIPVGYLKSYPRLVGQNEEDSSQFKEGTTRWYSGECFTAASQKKKKRMHVCAITVHYAFY